MTNELTPQQMDRIFKTQIMVCKDCWYRALTAHEARFHLNETKHKGFENKHFWELPYKGFEKQ